MILTLHYKNSIVQSPPISVLDRKTFDSNTAAGRAINANNNNGFTAAVVHAATTTIPNGAHGDMFNVNGRITFTLKRSGRIVRKVDGAPPLYLRNWKQIGKECRPDSQQRAEISLDMAETLYILKPMIHLGGCALFGYKSWRSWSLALLTDLISLRMYMTNRQLLTKIQKVEISRRIISILLYLMRSPFYDRHTRDKVNALLAALLHHIPFTKAIVGPLKDYIPYWQDTYFHMWS